MVASVLALSLLGLSAVNALPAQPVEERQTWTIGGGGSSFGGGGLRECTPGVPDKEQGPCLMAPITGGLNPPPKTLPKQRRDQAQETLKRLQQDLVKLQNKENKSSADKQKIKALQAAIKHLSGVVAISAPPGSSTTFIPGKRDLITFEPIGAFSSQCPKSLEGYKKAIQRLQTIRNPSLDDILNIQRLTHILTGCGYAISDDSATLIKISDKRSEKADSAIVTSLQNAYTASLEGLGGSAPAFNTWLLLQGVADQLEYYGVSVDRSVGLGGLNKRQGDWRLGCQGADLISVITLWNALVHDFGRDISKWPRDIFWQYYTLLRTLEACGVIVGGLIPNPTVPGGPLTPNPTVPGGTLRPDPVTPGGPLKPDPVATGAPLRPDPVVPGGALIPEVPVPGGSIKPDPAVPGGPMTPDPTTPGGSLKPPKVKRSSPNAATLEAVQILDKYYGPPVQSSKSGGQIVDLGDKGVVVIGWPSTRFGISP